MANKKFTDEEMKHLHASTYAIDISLIFPNRGISISDSQSKWQRLNLKSLPLEEYLIGKIVLDKGTL